MRDGTQIGTYDIGQLPNITGSFRANCNISKWSVLFNGAFYKEADLGSDSKGSTGNDMHHYTYGFDASRSSSVYNNDESGVVPRHLTMNFIIKC